LNKQKNDKGSLYNFYRTLIRYRNNSKTLTYGEIEHAGIPADEIVGFVRKHEEEERLVLHNVSDVEVTIILTDKNSRFNEIDFDTQGGNITIRDGELKLPAFSTVILKQD